MFGTYRTALAMLVVLAHIGAGFGPAGRYAVFGFFILSGYLMTRIMHRTYGYTPRGLGAYALNRFLRIFPPYWVALAAMAISLGVLGEPFAQSIREAIGFSESWAQMLGASVLVIVPGAKDIPLPQAWALTIELTFYILIGLGLSKSKRTTTIWLAVSGVYFFGSILLRANAFDALYFSFTGASLPFAIGSALYHYRESLPRISHCLVLLGLVGMAGVACAAAKVLGIYDVPGKIFFAIVVIAQAVIVGLLLQLKPTGFLRNADAAIGNISYPIYLLHYLAALWVQWCFPSLDKANNGLLLATIVPLLAVSTVMAATVDRWSDALRDKVKARIHRASPPPARMAQAPIESC